MKEFVLTVTITIHVLIQPTLPPALGAAMKPEEREQSAMKTTEPYEPSPTMNYHQYRRMRQLVHKCCNYDDGNCIALDDGEECVCVQSISYSLLCRWFRTAILPLDKELETALFHRQDGKRCVICGALFLPGSNRAKYCQDCAGRERHHKEAARQRKRYTIFTHLEQEKV